MSVITFPVRDFQQSPTVTRPASSGIVSVWLARHRHRKMLRNSLLPQPDSVLADAGMCREQAKREADKPFWRA